MMGALTSLVIGGRRHILGENETVKFAGHTFIVETRKEGYWCYEKAGLFIPKPKECGVYKRPKTDVVFHGVDVAAFWLCPKHMQQLVYQREGVPIDDFGTGDERLDALFDALTCGGAGALPSSDALSDF